ncbi:MAG: hypothetical protein WD623_08910 [Marinobacter sp.]|uniref:hypothetical protein n=1 Tax=Marinobacter sp. TaxID=50741 RepID=UPI0034A00821
MKPLRLGRYQRGALHATSAAMITVIAMVAGIATTQLALTSNAKTTLDYAALMAARAGAVAHGDEKVIMEGLFQGLAPLYGSSSAPLGAPADGATGVDWVVPDPSTVDKFSQTLMGENSNFSTQYRADIQRTERGDASVDAAVTAAQNDLTGGAGNGAMIGVAIINPVREVFADFGQMKDGLMELPNKGIWRRTGNINNAGTSNIQVCTAVAEPYYEDPTTPPSFNEPSGETVRTIFRTFTWDRDLLKQEDATDCSSPTALGCGFFGGESMRDRYINGISGPYGEALESDIDGIINEYINAEIDSTAMYRRIRERAERMKAEFEAADVESVRYCRTNLGAICFSRRTYTPESKDWGPMSRIDELIEVARMLENGTGEVPLGGSLPLDSFETAIGDWRERNQKDGGASSEWDNFVGTELEPLWKEWIEDQPVPLYKNFMEEASKAAQAFQGQSGLTESQKRYLAYLQAVNGGVYEPDIDYVQSENCETKQVAGYVAPTIGAQSDLNIQDANVLRLYVLYGHEPFFDLPESFYNAMGWTSRLTPTGRDAVPSSLQDEYTAIVAAGRIPLMSTALVRMQSELRESPLLISRNDSFFNWDTLGVE